MEPFSPPVRHRFIRPVERAPGRPAPDECVECGRPEAEHVTRSLPGMYDPHADADAVARRLLGELTGEQLSAFLLALMGYVRVHDPALFLRAVRDLGVPGRGGE